MRPELLFLALAAEEPGRQHMHDIRDALLISDSTRDLEGTPSTRSAPGRSQHRQVTCLPERVTRVFFDIPRSAHSLQDAQESSGFVASPYCAMDSWIWWPNGDPSTAVLVRADALFLPS
jgi:hypothetical protein